MYRLICVFAGYLGLIAGCVFRWLICLMAMGVQTLSLGGRLRSVIVALPEVHYLNQCTAFLTRQHVRPTNSQIILRIHPV